MAAAKASKEARSSERTPLREALHECRYHFFFVAVFSAVLNLLFLSPSLYMLQVYDRVMVTGGVLTLVFLSIVLLGCLAALAFLDATRARLLAAASRRLDRLISPLLLSAPFKRAPRLGARPPHPVREFDQLRAAITGPAALAAVDAPWSPLYIAVCFIIHPWLGSLALGGGALLVGIAFLNEIALRRAMRGQEDAGTRIYAMQHADAAHAEAARALGMSATLVARQQEARAGFSESQSKAVGRGAYFTATTKFVRLSLQSAALGLGAFLAVQQEISAGAVIACSILTARALAPLEQIVGAWRQFGMAAHAVKAVNAALAELAPERDYTELPEVRGVLSVEQASVNAPDRRVLSHVSFRVVPGEIIGVIGPSGGGKSSLIRALVGATALDEGAVRLDGARLADWPPDKLGRIIGYLPQEVSLFAGTVAQNISRFDARDDAGAIDRAVMAAAAEAGVHDMILRLPKGYDTELGPDGRGLSAGQAQRVGLARALYGDPAVIVLDEPNSHVDAEGEAALVAALKSAQARGATIIVVAHRAGFMSIADKLLVMRDGRLEEFGPRDEVMMKLAAAGGQPRPAVPTPAGSGQYGQRR